MHFHFRFLSYINANVFEILSKRCDVLYYIVKYTIFLPLFNYLDETYGRISGPTLVVLKLIHYHTLSSYQEINYNVVLFMQIFYIV